jgi:hypothetical protein
MGRKLSTFWQNNTSQIFALQISSHYTARGSNMTFAFSRCSGLYDPF